MASIDLRQSFDAAPLLAAAKRIEYRQPFGLDTARALLTTVERVAQSGLCDDDAARAALTISLLVQQAENPARNFEAWGQGLARLDALLRAGLRCTPSNGNFWARLALTERASSPGSPKSADMMRMSAAYAPAEAGSLKARAEVWRTSPALADALPSARDRDLRTILTQARPSEAARMLRDASPELTAEIKKILHALPTVRATALLRGGLLAEPPEEGVAPQDGYFGGLFPHSRR